MSKMNDMAMTIEELRNAAAAINDAANWLAQQFSSDSKQQNINVAAKAEKETKPVLTLEEVRAVLADKSRAGHTAEIRELLKKYGANKLSLVDPKHYEALLQEAEVL
jgi:integrase